MGKPQRPGAKVAALLSELRPALIGHLRGASVRRCVGASRPRRKADRAGRCRLGRRLSSKHLSCTLSVAFVQPTGSRRPLLGPVLLSQSQSSEEHAPAGGRRASVVGPRARGCRPSSAPSGDHGGGTAHTGFHPPYWRRHASRSKAQAGGLGRAQQRAPLVDFDAQTADGCPTPAAERQRCR